jgi:integration host factor subunit alpha
MALTKSQIAKQVHDIGFSKKASTEIVDTLLEIIKARLENGEDILVSGFGKFCVKDKPPRRGRNPATGEDLMLEGRRVVTFKPSGKLRNRINGKS